MPGAKYEVHVIPPSAERIRSSATPPTCANTTSASAGDTARR
jgi:hypothetical protein